MIVETSPISDVRILSPRVFTDERGSFMETYNARALAELGINEVFVQDNYSRSKRNVLRGLHYQISQPQGKLIRVTLGRIYDVAVDLRRQSATFGQHVATELSAENRKIMWLPVGFAHGFLVLSDIAEVAYKTTDYYSPEAERTIAWNDPDLGIDWPMTRKDVVLSAKDAAGQPFRKAEYF
jgi:dTDP-4-dehydrorhamnose 3,5-epimerase